jgi:hypothetical protein
MLHLGRYLRGVHTIYTRGEHKKHIEPIKLNTQIAHIDNILAVPLQPTVAIATSADGSAATSALKPAVDKKTPRLDLAWAGCLFLPFANTLCCRLGTQAAQ